MKKFLVFLLFIPVLLLALCNDKIHSGEETDSFSDSLNRLEKVTYKLSEEVICNPERGFFTHQEYTTDNTHAITPEFLKECRNKGMSLLFTAYYMKDFRDKLISAEYLQRIRDNMQALRKGGAKAVLRFAYTSSENEKPWDAPWELTEQHIQQLKPIIEEFSDVICVLEAGFVGVWGEWYYTDHYNYQPKKDEYGPRRKVLDALLKVMPADRMISVRYPAAKLFTFNMTHTDTISRQTAYNGSNLSRISFHNDCFLADMDDMGTFGENPDYRQFWEWETKYVAMGGETCRKSEYSTCENAVADLAKYHWSYINIDYHPAVINQWESEQCMNEIKQRLGYRFTLSDGYFTPKGEIGHPYEIVLNLQNTGWAAPFNPRDVEVVFVHRKEIGNRYKIKLKEDPRFWFPGEQINIKARFGLPESMPAGEYDIYLNLPDSRPTIATRWEYSIQLANENVWDKQRGYNKIHSTVLVNTSSKESFEGEALQKF